MVGSKQETPTSSDLPFFAVRGVIEGFYGPVWSAEQRLDLVRFIAAHGMNFYGYAPKDDPLCRHDWDCPLSPGDLDAVRTLIKTGSELGVSVAYGVAPAISISYSDRNDRDRLRAKFRQVADAGGRHFLLLFDDVPLQLQHAADQVVYESLVDAQADLANYVRDALDVDVTGAELMVCPTVYCGRGDEPYVRRLGLLLDSRIDIFWTGRTVWASELDSRDARHFHEHVGRSPLYWDNYPANDLFMSDHVHLGPYRGRDRDLGRFARGVVVNPMKQVESSKISLATIADYLLDPQSYDAEASWLRAIAEVGGERDAEAWRLFADNVRSSCLEVSESPMLTAMLERVRFAARLGAAEAERAAAIDLLGLFADAAEQLLGPQVENKTLAAELRLWLLAFQAGTKMLLAALQYGRLLEGNEVERVAIFSSLALDDLLPDALPQGRRTHASRQV